MPEDENNVVPDLDGHLAALPRERMPSRLLEERTVKALRARGLLRHRRFGAFWMAAAAAAVALFAGGFALGQWTGSRTMTDSMLAIQQQSAEDAAALVQRTGSAYVLALASLASHADATPGAELDQGREVALAALYAAARELAEIAPDDPVSAQIRRLVAGTRDPTLPQDDEPRSVMWF